VIDTYNFSSVCAGAVAPFVFDKDKLLFEALQEVRRPSLQKISLLVHKVNILNQNIII
jgi:hypothetical protein